jgi:hypothetical protein
VKPRQSLFLEENKRLSRRLDELSPKLVRGTRIFENQIVTKEVMSEKDSSKDKDFRKNEMLQRR